MKVLYLIRHAKSSWKNLDIDDFDRPLNKRGKRDAPFMGQLLKKYQIQPDLILSSPANRALTTAKVIANEIEYPEEKIVTEDVLYGSDSGSMLRMINQIDNQIKVLMVFCHNPGITDLAEELTGTLIGNIPTCGICCIKFNLDSWDTVFEGTGKLDFFDYPKKLKQSL